MNTALLAAIVDTLGTLHAATGSSAGVATAAATATYVHGDSGTSAGVATASASATLTALDTTNLHTLLDLAAANVTLNGSDISAVTSIEGNSRVFQQATANRQPAYNTPGLNGRNTCNFTQASTNDSIKSTAAASTWKFLSDGSGCTIIIGVELSANTGTTQTIASTGSTGTSEIAFTLRYDGTNQKITVNITTATQNIVNTTSANGSVTRSAAHVISFTYLESADNWVLRCDGTQLTTGTTSNTPSSSDPASALSFGCLGNATSNPWVGEIESCAIYSAQLSGATLLAAERWIGNRIGVSF